MAPKFKSTKFLNVVTIVWCWTFYCVLGSGLLPNLVMGARYLPTRRSTPTELERTERMRELFQHILESERDAHLSAANQFSDQLKLIRKKSDDFYSMPAHFAANYEKMARSKDYGDEPLAVESDYDDKSEHSQFDDRKPIFRQSPPWRFVLSNYARGGKHRSRKPIESFPHIAQVPRITSMDNADHSNAINGDASNDNANNQQNFHEFNQPIANDARTHRILSKLHQTKQPPIITASMSNDRNNENSESPNGMEWINSNAELNEANDYDALYDENTEQKRGLPPKLRFNRYRRNNNIVAMKQHQQHEEPQLRLHQQQHLE